MCMVCTISLVSGAQCSVYAWGLGTEITEAALVFIQEIFCLVPSTPRLMGGSSVSDPVTAFLHRWQNSSGHMTSRQLTHWLTTYWDEEAGPVWMLSWRLNFNKPGGWGWGRGEDCQERKEQRCKVRDDWNKFIEIEGLWEVSKHWWELRFRMEVENNQTQICWASEGVGVVASPATLISAQLAEPWDVCLHLEAD